MLLQFQTLRQGNVFRFPLAECAPSLRSALCCALPLAPTVFTHLSCFVPSHQGLQSPHLCACSRGPDRRYRLGAVREPRCPTAHGQGDKLAPNLPLGSACREPPFSPYRD